MRRLNPAGAWKSYKRLKRTGKFSASPPMVLAGGFLVLIAVGTLLLSLPFSTTKPIGLFTALFTATSAVTVTGLTLVEVGPTFTYFGQVVLALLVQIGGLGFVTLAVVTALALGKRLSLQQQSVVLEAFNQTSVARIRQTAFAVFKISAAIELVAVIILTLWWWPQSDLLTALYRAVFHTIMGFNNAGFVLEETALSRFVGDPITILVTTVLIILGGIGFSVLNDVRHKRRWQRLTVYTRTLILATLGLNVAGFVLVWVFEHNNPHTLGALPVHAQALSAWLQSVTARTAGFSSFDIIHLTDSSTLIMMLLMFIGGGSLSTASGIKVGTFVILLAASYSYVRRRPEVVLLKRSIAPAIVQKSLALLLAAAGILFIGTLALTVLEDKPLIDLSFEVMSAFSTTGLTRNLTSELSSPSQFILMILMFVGRIGPLTFIYSLSTQGQSRVRYPETQYQVG